MDTDQHARPSWAETSAIPFHGCLLDLDHESRQGFQHHMLVLALCCPGSESWDSVHPVHAMPCQLLWWAPPSNQQQHCTLSFLVA